MKKEAMGTSTCPVCGKNTLKSITGEFKAYFEDENGNRRDLIVPNVTYEKCDSCGEELLDQNATNKISHAQRAAMGLLSADQIRAIRQNLAKTQRQMSELLGIGEKTYCRWESGTHFQSEAFDRYLRLLRADPSALRTLERIGHDKAAEQAGLNAGGFEYLKDPQIYELLSVQFNELLQKGPFYRA